MSSLPPILVTVSLTPSEYRPFVCAAHRLRRILGARAPKACTLIQANLRGRDARGLAEDYLDVIGWPPVQRRTRRPLPQNQTMLAKAVRTPPDPSRN